MKHIAYFLLFGSFFFFSGCSFTHGGRYMPPASENPVTENNLYDIEDLGVGYDRIYMNPEDLSENSVRGRSVRPKVFEFIPDPNPYNFIDIPQLGAVTDGTKRRSMALGVFAETNPRFDWQEEARFVYKAKDYRKEFETSYFGSAGLTGIASFSGSASFNSIHSNTKNSQNTYVYKDGVYRGYTLALDKDYTHQLTQEFKNDVEQLDSELSYDNFLFKWGTHYSESITMGAKCSYRLKFTKEDNQNFSGGKESFEAKVSGGLKGLEIGFGTSNATTSAQSQSETIGASDVKFISYGGSGAGTSNFTLWTQHATLNPTIIDAALVGYENLLTPKYFPQDTLINVKKSNLIWAYERYYTYEKQNFARFEIDNNIPFFVDNALAKFEFKVLNYEYQKQGDGVNQEYWMHGTLNFGLRNREQQYKNLATFWYVDILGNGQEQRTYIPITANVFVLVKDIKRSLQGKDYTFGIPVSKISDIDITLNGKVSRWMGTSNTTFRSLDGRTDFSVLDIKLAELTVDGDSKIVTFNHKVKEDSEEKLVITFLIKRLE